MHSLKLLVYTVIYLSVSYYLLQSVIFHLLCIPVREKITYLGVVIAKNQATRCSDNFIPAIDKTFKNSFSGSKEIFH